MSVTYRKSKYLPEKILKCQDSEIGLELKCNGFAEHYIFLEISSEPNRCPSNSSVGVTGPQVCNSNYLFSHVSSMICTLSENSEAPRL